VTQGERKTGNSLRGGAIANWHVDDLEGTLERVKAK